MIQVPDQPQTAVTLAHAKAYGLISPLDRKRLRAQLGMVDKITALDLRRATELLLQRVIDYYAVIQYTSPGYIYGRVDSSYGSALRAEPEFNRYYNTWQYREMTPEHPTCTDASLFAGAGWMCTATAAKLAAMELAEEVPEAAELLRKARYAIAALLSNSATSGTNWNDSRRRMRTPGIRKVLLRVQSAIPAVAIGLGVVCPVILGPGEAGMVASVRNVSDWSLPADQHVERLAA